MLLTLMRHGIAERFAGSDADRQLTEAGRRITHDVIGGLKSGGWMPGVIVCSPLTRSRQTAAVVMEAFPGTPLEILPEVLSPEEELLEEMSYRDMVDPLVVGHEPGLSRLSARLLNAQGVLGFQPAALACFRVDGLPPRRPSELLFFAPPIFARCFK
ncbi:MAG: histidine phosphatase family protein [Alphaproteobacteria bacterium]|nr:histidine phosphatase family protein [Alphaproteobacteria bacterium]